MKKTGNPSAVAFTVMTKMLMPQLISYLKGRKKIVVYLLMAVYFLITGTVINIKWLFQLINYFIN